MAEGLRVSLSGFLCLSDRRKMCIIRFHGIRQRLFDSFEEKTFSLLTMREPKAFPEFRKFKVAAALRSSKCTLLCTSNGLMALQMKRT